MIQVQDVCYAYPGMKEDTIKEIGFSVGQGEIFGFLGPSGAGKSTLQKILTGTLRGYRGSVCVLDMEVNKRTAGFYEEIGVDFEFPNFYGKFTAMENLRYFSSLYHAKTENIDGLLDRVGLLADRDKRVSGYSKGMKMRLAFVRCLLHNPRLLFLDEPTSGLDPANARTLKEMILEQKAMGKTVILTTHNMHDAEALCDRVAFIVDGRIKALDFPAALRNSSDGHITVGYSVQADGITNDYIIPISALGDDARFMGALRSGTLTRIHSQEQTLEDIFIRLTGRTLQ